MDIPCDCMVTQQDDGSIKCRRCNGDFYACEYPVVHSIRCPEHSTADEERLAEWTRNDKIQDLDDFEYDMLFNDWVEEGIRPRG